MIPWAAAACRAEGIKLGARGRPEAAAALGAAAEAVLGCAGGLIDGSASVNPWLSVPSLCYATARPSPSIGKRARAERERERERSAPWSSRASADDPCALPRLSLLH